MIIKKLLFILFFVPVMALSESLKEQAEQVILNQMGTDVSLHFEKYDIPADIKTRVQNQSRQKFYSRFVYFWKITKNDSPVAHAFLDNVKGKSALITFLVILDKNNQIHFTDILKYRGSHGRNVTHRGWLDLFNGKDMHSEFNYGGNIDAVSGATISAHAMIKGVKKCLYLFKEIQLAE